MSFLDKGTIEDPISLVGVFRAKVSMVPPFGNVGEGRSSKGLLGIVLQSARGTEAQKSPRT